MTKRRINLGLLALTLFACVFFSYLYLFPNDFFLPVSQFKKAPERYYFSKTFSKLCIYDKERVTPAILDIIENPDKYLKYRYFKNKKGKITKNNSKRTIAEVLSEDQSVVLKRYNFKSFYDWITKCPFRSSKAYRAWYYANALEENNIATAPPIAIIENRWGPFWTKTYFITSYVDAPTLLEAAPKLALEDIKRSSQQIEKALKIFHKKKWLHRDFVTRNILLEKKQICIIDLDEMHSYHFNNFIFQKKIYKKHFLRFAKSAKGAAFLTSSGFYAAYDCN